RRSPRLCVVATTMALSPLAAAVVLIRPRQQISSATIGTRNGLHQQTHRQRSACSWPSQAIGSSSHHGWDRQRNHCYGDHGCALLEGEDRYLTPLPAPNAGHH